MYFTDFCTPEVSLQCCITVKSLFFIRAVYIHPLQAVTPLGYRPKRVAHGYLLCQLSVINLKMRKQDAEFMVL